MTRTILVLFAAIALLIGACGDDDDTAATTTTQTSETSTTDASTTTTTDPDETDGWQRCDNPEGFSLSYPADWETNDGSVVAECSQFDPESFQVPEATDARVAAITAFVDPVAFNDVAAPERDSENQRDLTAVDGHQAVRLEGPAGELYPDDATSVRYIIDLSLGIDDGAGTLFVDTIELSDMDFDRNVGVLDRMVRTIELDAEDQFDRPVVARYEGGSNLFSAGGYAEAGERCVAAPLDENTMTECFNPPGSDALRFADLSGDLFPLLAGVTGTSVFRIEVEQPSSTTSYLPVRIPDTDSRGFAVPITPDDGTRISWYDIDGNQLGTRGVDQESSVEPIGAFEDPPVTTDDFPASGTPSLLRDIRIAPHDGFDRVVFEFEPGQTLSWQVEAADEVQSTSGEPLDLQGDAVLRVVMAPATGVDLSGQQPQQIYTGPERIDPGSTAVVTELAQAEDFESTLTWGIGLSSESQIAVAELSDPRRLVIDVRTG